MAPAGTPPAVTAKVRAATHAALDTREVQGLFGAQGIDIIKTDAAEFARHVGGETAKWTKLIRSAGIKHD